MKTKNVADLLAAADNFKLKLLQAETELKQLLLAKHAAKLVLATKDVGAFIIPGEHAAEFNYLISAAAKVILAAPNELHNLSSDVKSAFDLLKGDL